MLTVYVLMTSTYTACYFRDSALLTMKLSLSNIVVLTLVSLINLVISSSLLLVADKVKTL
jgi:hypothetical protein